MSYVLSERISQLIPISVSSSSWTSRITTSIIICSGVLSALLIAARIFGRLSFVSQTIKELLFVSTEMLPYSEDIFPIAPLRLLALRNFRVTVSTKRSGLCSTTTGSSWFCCEAVGFFSANAAKGFSLPTLASTACCGCWPATTRQRLTTNKEKRVLRCTGCLIISRPLLIGHHINGDGHITP
ncbi:hypothetical protein ES703_17662 [subsurface metagenome]